MNAFQCYLCIPWMSYESTAKGCFQSPEKCTKVPGKPITLKSILKNSEAFETLHWFVLENKYFLCGNLSSQMKAQYPIRNIIILTILSRQKIEDLAQ